MNTVIPGSMNIELEQIHYNLHNTKEYLIPTISFSVIPPPINSSLPILTLKVLAQASESKLYLYKTIEQYLIVINIINKQCSFLILKLHY